MQPKCAVESETPGVGQVDLHPAGPELFDISVPESETPAPCSKSKELYSVYLRFEPVVFLRFWSEKGPDGRTARRLWPLAARGIASIYEAIEGSSAQPNDRYHPSFTGRCGDGK